MISCSLTAQIREKLEEEIGKIIFYDTEISFKNTPAYLIGVQLGDSSFVFPYGNISKTQGAPQSDQLFEIGGLTKSFTALIAGILMNEGRLHPDSSLNHYLPAHFRNPTAGAVSILDLVQHTTGLPRLPDGIGLKEKDPANPFGHYTKNDLLNYYLEVDFNLIKTNTKPSRRRSKKQYKYSHTNYALLEIALELAADQTYEQLLTKYIFQPCDMQQSGVHDFTTENRNRIVRGYSLGGQPTPPWQMRSFAGSEGIKSSMDDLLKYMRASLKNKTHQLGPVLAHNQQPLVATDMAKHIFGGNGWHVITNKNYYDVIMHAGSTTGYRSFMGFVSESETGVVILANSPHSMNGLGLLILRMINNNWKRTRNGMKTGLSGRGRPN